jgi:hypothetical protein
MRKDKYPNLILKRFCDTITWNILRDLLFRQNQPPKPSDD